MDEDTKEMIVALLPVLMRCSQDTAEYIRQLLQILLVVIRPLPDSFLDIRHKILNGQIESWGRMRYIF